MVVPSFFAFFEYDAAGYKALSVDNKFDKEDLKLGSVIPEAVGVGEMPNSLHSLQKLLFQVAFCMGLREKEYRPHLASLAV
jgi:hypothetical protein